MPSMGKTRKKEKTKKNNNSKKKECCYRILETLVDEFGNKLLSLADAQAPITVWEFEVQRVEFLKKLVRAEFASNPEKTKHLRHISDRIHALEEALHVVLEMIRQHTDTAASSSSFALTLGGTINQDDSLSLCSCSNYGDDEDEDDDDDNEGLQLLPVEVSCATTVEDATVPVPPNYKGNFNGDGESRRFVEMEKVEEARKRGSKVTIKYYWLIIVVMMCFSGFFLFTNYYNNQEDARVILTPT